MDDLGEEDFASALEDGKILMREKVILNIILYMYLNIFLNYRAPRRVW